MLWLDIETSGLDPYRHEILEIAYAIDDDAPYTLIFPHYLLNADPKALEINRYYERGLARKRSWAKEHELEGLQQILQDQTIAGSNPAFDVSFLRAYDYSGWKHRLMDVPLWVAGHFGWLESAGLQRTITYMNMKKGHNLPYPDHSAKGDIIATRALFKAVLGDIHGIEASTLPAS